MDHEWKRYLLWFAHEHVDFRKAEMDSILDMFDINWKTIFKPEELVKPYWIVELPSECALRKIASRSVSLRFGIELWANDVRLEGLHEKLRLYPEEEIKFHTDCHKSFKIVVETFCKHLSQTEKIEKIETFDYLPTRGPVRLKNPDTTLTYIEFYGLDPNAIPEKPYELFFGRWIADGQRDSIQRLSLKTRKFIGNTSMDPQLSLLMANQARVKNGDLVLDPFVGTGSLLVAASQFGGYTWGTDIDFLMLHGRTKPSRISQKRRGNDESIATNMNQYGKGSYYLDILVSDFSRPLWKSDFRVDSVITDPPYGIREATERVGSAKENPVIDEHRAADHIPSKIGYGLSQIFKDLLIFSAKHLKIDGRLVCWFPLFREHYSEDQLPAHPCLRLKANSEQVLSKYTSRRLLTYEKTREPRDLDAVGSINETDFREKYFALRDETRKESRMRRAKENAKRKANWERSKRESTER